MKRNLTTMKQFSTDDLIADLYHENNPEISAALQEAISQNWALQEKKQVIVEAVQLLQSGWQHPRASIISNLLAYAEATEAKAEL